MLEVSPDDVVSTTLLGRALGIPWGPSQALACAAANKPEHDAVGQVHCDRFGHLLRVSKVGYGSVLDFSEGDGQAQRCFDGGRQKEPRIPLE